MVGRFGALLVLLALATVDAIRVRREIRSLSSKERNLFFDALWTMKRTAGEEGRKIYGDQYMSMDEVVIKHGHASLDPRCDQGHFGPAFAIYHRLFTWMFENSLLSIAPELGAVPYWNMDIDKAEFVNPDDSIIWSSDWFGSAHPRAEDGYMVKDGYFANWPIAKAKDVGGDFENGYGYLRAPWNALNTPNLTRIPLMCESPHILNGSQARTNECNAEEDFMGWYTCVDNLVAGENMQPHLWIGGMVSRDRVPRNLVDCTNGWVGDSASDTGMIYDYLTGCVQCPTNCTSMNVELCLCSWVPEEGGCANKDFNEGYAGDFFSPVASPNDPIFLVHHTNIDRQLMEWQVKYVSQFEGGMANYEGFFTYPESGKCQGHNLDDVVSSADPFYGLIKELSGPHTIKDILNYTRLGVNSPWTYDTLI